MSITKLACSLTLLAAAMATTSYAQSPSTDLSRLLELIDQRSLSSADQAAELRNRHANDPQLAAIYDLGYGIVQVKFADWTKATAVLEPFVQARPHVHRARIMLIRSFIGLDRLDAAALQVESLIQKLPSDEPEREMVARFCGDVYGYLKFARLSDCPDDLRVKLEKAVAELDATSRKSFDEAAANVEARVAALQEEVDRLTDKTASDIDEKIAENMETADKLRSAAEANNAELETRDKDRADQLQQLQSNLQKVEMQATQLATQQQILDRQITALNLLQARLVANNTTPGTGGAAGQPTQTISNPVQYNQLGREIALAFRQRTALSAQGRALQATYQQLMTQARGLMSQKQLDELATKSKMNQLNKTADSKQKRAERDSNHKDKNAATAARGVQAKIKNFATYNAFDLASEKAYLQQIAARFMSKH